MISTYVGYRNRVVLKELVLFKHVYEGDNFRESAKKAGTSIASLSRAIAGLERDCGKKLFLKDGTSTIPTNEARSLYYSVVDSLNSINHEYEVFRNHTPQITLLKPLQVHSELFVQLLHDEEIMGSQFSFKERNNYPSRNKAYADLLIGEIDLFIDKKPIQDRRYQCHKIAVCDLVFIYSKQFHPQTLDLADERLIKLKWLDDYSEKFVVNANSGEYLIDSLVSFYEIIKNSKYVGIAPKQTANQLNPNHYWHSEPMGQLELYLIAANRNLVNKPVLQQLLDKIKTSELILR